MRLFAAILLLLLVSGCVQQDTACFDEQCFSIEIVETSDERERGLMHRESLDSNSGMLFIFPEEGYHSFWMKNTLIPLDIIWISDDMRIVHIIMDAQPCPEDGLCTSIDPPADAKYVLEVNSGKSHGLNIGDTVALNVKE